MKLLVQTYLFDYFLLCYFKQYHVMFIGQLINLGFEQSLLSLRSSSEHMRGEKGEHEKWPRRESREYP